jgi:hypothetical protein
MELHLTSLLNLTEGRQRKLRWLYGISFISLVALTLFALILDNAWRPVYWATNEDNELKIGCGSFWPNYASIDGKGFQATFMYPTVIHKSLPYFVQLTLLESPSPNLTSVEIDWNVDWSNFDFPVQRIFPQINAYFNRTHGSVIGSFILAEDFPYDNLNFTVSMSQDVLPAAKPDRLTQTYQAKVCDSKFLSQPAILGLKLSVLTGWAFLAGLVVSRGQISDLRRLINSKTVKIALPIGALGALGSLAGFRTPMDSVEASFQAHLLDASNVFAYLFILSSAPIWIGLNVRRRIMTRFLGGRPTIKKRILLLALGIAQFALLFILGGPLFSYTQQILFSRYYVWMIPQFEIAIPTTFALVISLVSLSILVALVSAALVRTGNPQKNDEASKYVSEEH